MAARRGIPGCFAAGLGLALAGCASDPYPTGPQIARALERGQERQWQDLELETGDRQVDRTVKQAGRALGKVLETTTQLQVIEGLEPDCRPAEADAAEPVEDVDTVVCEFQARQGVFGASQRYRGTLKRRNRTWRFVTLPQPAY